MHSEKLRVIMNFPSCQSRTVDRRRLCESAHLSPKWRASWPMGWGREEGGAVTSSLLPLSQANPQERPYRTWPLWPLWPYFLPLSPRPLSSSYTGLCFWHGQTYPCVGASTVTSACNSLHMAHSLTFSKPYFKCHLLSGELFKIVPTSTIPVLPIPLPCSTFFCYYSLPLISFKYVVYLFLLRAYDSTWHINSDWKSRMN